MKDWAILCALASGAAGCVVAGPGGDQRGAYYGSGAYYGGDGYYGGPAYFGADRDRDRHGEGRDERSDGRRDEQANGTTTVARSAVS